LELQEVAFYVEYKAKLEGLPVVYVSPKGTSSLCPVWWKISTEWAQAN
jgi:transposase